MQKIIIPSPSYKNIIREAKSCRLCVDKLPLEPNPVFLVDPNAKILIAAQAPGVKVHETGVPFNDPSGDSLREWMGVDRKIFYNHNKISFLPMGFCFPGTGKSGDLSPRKECANKWRKKLLECMPNIKLTLIIGQYAINWHLKNNCDRNLTETVKSWKDYYPLQMPLPHPSPRNNLWLKRNPWFKKEVIPELQKIVLENL